MLKKPHRFDDIICSFSVIRFEPNIFYIARSFEATAFIIEQKPAASKNAVVKTQKAPRAASALEAYD